MFETLAKNLAKANLQTILLKKGVWGCVYFNGLENNSDLSYKITADRVDISPNGSLFSDVLGEACQALEVDLTGQRNPMLFAIQQDMDAHNGSPCSILLDPEMAASLGLTPIEVSFWCESKYWEGTVVHCAAIDAIFPVFDKSKFSSFEYYMRSIEYSKQKKTSAPYLTNQARLKDYLKYLLKLSEEIGEASFYEKHPSLVDFFKS